MIKIIASIFAVLSGVIISLFYFLIKEKQKQIDSELEQLDALARSGERYKNEKHEMEKDIASMGDNGSGNNFDNSLNFLQKLHEKGESRFK